MFTQNTQAEPDFKIPPIQESMKKCIKSNKKILPLKTNITACLLRYHQKHRKNWPHFYTLDGNAQFPMAVNAVNPNKPLPLIVSIGYISDKAYVIEERTRDYTFPAEGAEFAKGGKAADFLRFYSTRRKALYWTAFRHQ